MWVRVWNCNSVLSSAQGWFLCDVVCICPGLSGSAKLCVLSGLRRHSQYGKSYVPVLIWRVVLDGGSGLWWGMVEVNVHGEVSAKWERARVSVRFLESCRCRVLLRLYVGSFSNVSGSVQFIFRIRVRQVSHPSWCYRVKLQVCARVRIR